MKNEYMNMLPRVWSLLFIRLNMKAGTLWLMDLSRIHLLCPWILSDLLIK